MARANEVTDWNQIAIGHPRGIPWAGGWSTTALQVNMGMTQGAVYDALNAIEPRYQPYLLADAIRPSASKEAATATAA